MPKKKPQKTATRTSSVTNTKLAVATVALLAAGGLAFAALPASYVNKDGAKCGVNSYSVQSKCGAGKYAMATITCQDGETFQIGDKKSCHSADYLQEKAASICQGRCVAPPGPAPDAAKCKDTDGGENAAVRGTTGGNNSHDLGGYIERDDVCEGNVLAEFSCVTDEDARYPEVVGSSNIDCEEMGQVCLDGACVDRPVDADPVVHVDVNTSTLDAFVYVSTFGGITSGAWEVEANEGDIILDDMAFQMVAESREIERLDVERAINLVTEVSLLISRDGAENAALLARTIPDENGWVYFEGLDEEITEGNDATFYLQTTGRQIQDADETQAPLQYALARVSADSTVTGEDVPEENILLNGNQPLQESPLGIRISQPHVLVKSFPTMDTIPLQNTNLFNGNMDVYEFRLSAHNAGPISWAGVRVKIDGDCSAGRHVTDCMSNIRIYDQANFELVASSSVDDEGIIIELEDPETIGAGSSNVYRVTADLNGFGMGDVLQASIRRNNEQYFRANTMGNVLAALRANNQWWRPLVWSDNSGLFANPNDEHWFYGAEVEGLNTRREVLVFPN